MSNVNAEVVAEVVETNADGSEHWFDAKIISTTKKHYVVEFCSDGERAMIFGCKTLVGETSKKYPTDNPKAYRLILQEAALQESA